VYGYTLVRIAPLTSRAYGNFNPGVGGGNVTLVRQAQILVKIARLLSILYSDWERR